MGIPLFPDSGPHWAYDSPWSSFEEAQLFEFVKDFLPKAMNSEHLNVGLLFLTAGDKQLLLWTMELETGKS